MCGIVGYVGHHEAIPVLMDGLSRLSYRGYDSAGVAVLDEQSRLHVKKSRGKLCELEKVLKTEKLTGCLGIGHTRWATHGEPSDLNAHPHTDVSGGIAVVHNGIIENHEELKNYLKKQGITMRSQTDTEVIAHLINLLYHGNMVETLAQLIRMLQGSYAIGILCEKEPEKLFCTCLDSPLVIGFSDGEGYIASDVPAMLNHTRDVVFLQDHEIGVLKCGELEVYDSYGQNVPQTFTHVKWDQADAEKGGYTHFMLKEIHEQPEALKRSVSNRMSDDTWIPLTTDEVCSLEKVTIVACGTAYHAGLFGKYVIEQLARIPVEADVASEYRYRNPLIGKHELVIAVSQSGETADTLAALRMAKQRGARVIAVCNVVGSGIVREVGEENTLYTYAGPEIAVASTKAYLTQVSTLILFAVSLARIRNTAGKERLESLFDSFEKIEKLAERTIQTETQIQRIANTFQQKKHVFFVGRGLDYALSLEAALKLKEISYIFGEAYAAGELKHGPLALMQEGRLVVASATQPALLEKTISNLREVAARGAYMIAVTTNCMSEKIKPHVKEVILIPDCDPIIAPLLAAIPMQLFAYYMAVERGCDVDQPRNLAKSVTVE